MTTYYGNILRKGLRIYESEGFPTREEASDDCRRWILALRRIGNRESLAIETGYGATAPHFDIQFEKA